MGTPRSWTGNSSLIGGVGAILLFWSGNALSLVPLHMLVGLSTVTRLGRSDGRYTLTVGQRPIDHRQAVSDHVVHAAQPVVGVIGLVMITLEAIDVGRGDEATWLHARVRAGRMVETCLGQHGAASQGHQSSRQAPPPWLGRAGASNGQQ